MLAASLGAAERSPSELGLAYDTGWAHDENSGNGYAYFSAKTFVDCAHTRVGYRQSADIFTGGYAHAADGRVLSYADMGVLLENDDLAPGELARPNKVQLYGQASTSAGLGLLRFANAPDAPQHVDDVACNTQLTLTFFVASASEIDVRYDGTFVPKRGGVPFTGSVTARIAGFVPADGWSASCAFCAVRRVDTLAVGSGDRTRPGAYFGVLDRLGSRQPVEPWTGSVEGRYVAGTPGEKNSYALRPFAAIARDIVNSPRDAERLPQLRPAFLIRGEGTADERIGLDERQRS